MPGYNFFGPSSAVGAVIDFYLIIMGVCIAMFIIRSFFYVYLWRTFIDALSSKRKKREERKKRPLLKLFFFVLVIGVIYYILTVPPHI